MLLALGLFVTAGLTVSSALSRGLGAAAQDRQRTIASDLARSAMAQIEGGIETPQTLNGPVRAWQEESAQGDELDRGTQGIAFDETPPDDNGWELEITTEPSEFDGLRLASVTARRVDPESDLEIVSFTLHQLVRLSDDVPDIVGEVDPLVAEAERGARRASTGDGENGRDRGDGENGGNGR